MRPGACAGLPKQPDPLSNLRCLLGRIQVMPARSILSNALNFCRSAIATLVRCSARQEGHRYRLRRRAIDSAPFSSLVTGRAFRFWSAPRTDGTTDP